MTSISQNVSTSLSDTHPHLFLEWSSDNDRDFSDLSYGSSYKASWVCSKNSLHVWTAKVNNRTANRTGCPVCSGYQVLKGVTDLATVSPHLIEEWDIDANLPLTPELVTSRSSKRVNWVCSKDVQHKWVATINSRTTGRGCPYCANQRILVGNNDLSTTHPEVAAEWHPARNVVSIESITSGTPKRAWWLCADGHEWATRVFHRTVSGSGCPNCSLVGTSKIETSLRNFVGSKYSTDSLGDGPTKLNVSWSLNSSMSVDIYIPSIRTVIEYDGGYWHRDRVAQDTAKTMALLESGYQVVRVREGSLPDLKITHPSFHQINHVFDSKGTHLESLFSSIYDILS